MKCLTDMKVMQRTVQGFAGAEHAPEFPPKFGNQNTAMESGPQTSRRKSGFNDEYQVLEPTARGDVGQRLWTCRKIIVSIVTERFSMKEQCSTSGAAGPN